MVIKRVFTIKDENYSQTFEMAGQSGALISDDENFVVLDFCQMAQYLIENLCEDNKIKEDDIVEACTNWGKTLSGIILDSVFENAISDVEDDEELELIRE